MNTPFPCSIIVITFILYMTEYTLTVANSPPTNTASYVPQSTVASSVSVAETHLDIGHARESETWAQSMAFGILFTVMTQQLHSDIQKARSLIDLEASIRRWLIRVLYMVQYTMWVSSLVPSFNEINKLDMLFASVVNSIWLYINAILHDFIHTRRSSKEGNKINKFHQAFNTWK